VFVGKQAREVSRRHRALGLLFGAYALSRFDRQIVNILAPSIKNDFDLSDGQLGMLTGTAFAVLYSVSGIPLGRVADRVDRVKLIAATLVVWSGFTVVCGLTRNFL
jgi:MFS family permease